MASFNWIRKTALTYLVTLMGQLVTDGYLDLVTKEDSAREVQHQKRILVIAAGTDEQNLYGKSGEEVAIEANIELRFYFGKTEAGLLVDLLEDVLARARDRITAGIESASGFLAQDPAIQVEGISVTGAPIYSEEYDDSAAVLTLKIRNHG